MPKVTVYIREEDYPIWKSIKKKTAFIHMALVPHYGSEIPSEFLPDAGVVKRHMAKHAPEDLPIPEFKPCKHGYAPDMCRFAKSGKPCKMV